MECLQASHCIITKPAALLSAVAVSPLIFMLSVSTVSILFLPGNLVVENEDWLPSSFVLFVLFHCSTSLFYVSTGLQVPSCIAVGRSF